MSSPRCALSAIFMRAGRLRRRALSFSSLCSKLLTSGFDRRRALWLLANTHTNKGLSMHLSLAAITGQDAELAEIDGSFAAESHVGAGAT